MSIQFDELDTTIRVPTVAVETDLTSGRQSVPTLEKKALLLGVGLGTGSAVVGDLDQVTSSAHGRALYGEGSMLSLMVNAFLKVSPNTPLWAMPFTESAGVAATGVITLGAAPTAAGVMKWTAGGRSFRVPVSATDTITTVGDAMVAEMDNAIDLPWTSVNAVGVVTMTARLKGIEANSLRYRSSTTAAGLTTTDTGAIFAGGTLAGDPAVELATIEGRRFHIVVLGTDDATAIASTQAHVELLSTALNQKWGIGIAPSVTTRTAAAALVTTADTYRMQVVWQINAEKPMWEIAAAFGAERARVTTRNRTLDYHELAGLSATFDQTTWPTRSEYEAALAAGVTPLRSLENGRVEVVRSVLARVTSPAFIDHNPLEISDFIDEDLIAIYRARYKDAALKVSSPANTPNVLTQARALAVLHERMLIWDRTLDYTQGAALDIANERTEATPNAADTGRLDIGYPFRPVFGAHVIAVLKTFQTPDLI